MRIANKDRYSNFELLRILSMIMVLMGHANYKTFGYPSIDVIHDSFCFSLLRNSLETFSITAVNIFILISGWFGIKFSVKKILNIAFLLCFYVIGISIVLQLMGGAKTLSIDILIEYIFHGNYWFIYSYILLMIISPVLNTFTQENNKIKLKSFLIAFYIFQFLVGWLMKCETFSGGYSCISFIGLYLFARYLRIFGRSVNRKFAVIMIVLLILLNTSLITILTCYPFYNIDALKLISYNSPVIILLSVYILLFFKELNIKSKIVNYISSSVLAIYLIHMHPLFFDAYYVSKIWEFSYNPYKWIIIPLYITFIAFSSILIDKLRILLFCFPKGNLSIIR